jgi:hypothetical protein
VTEQKIGPEELSEALSVILTEVNSWLLASWDREQTDVAVEAWDRMDRLIGSLMIVRRDLGVLLARRLPDEYTTRTRDDDVTVHRTIPKTEKWNGHGVITDLAQPMVDADGEKVDAVPARVLRQVLPACGEGQVSSKWKIGELRKHLQAELYRTVEWGDPLLARGPLAYQARNTKPPDEPESEPAT